MLACWADDCIYAKSLECLYHQEAVVLENQTQEAYRLLRNAMELLGT